MAPPFPMKSDNICQFWAFVLRFRHHYSWWNPLCTKLGPIAKRVCNLTNMTIHHGHCKSIQVIRGENHLLAVQPGFCFVKLPQSSNCRSRQIAAFVKLLQPNLDISWCQSYSFMVDIVSRICWEYKFHNHVIYVYLDHIMYIYIYHIHQLHMSLTYLHLHHILHIWNIHNVQHHPQRLWGLPAGRTTSSCPQLYKRRPPGWAEDFHGKRWENMGNKWENIGNMLGFVWEHEKVWGKYEEHTREIWQHTIRTRLGKYLENDLRRPWCSSIFPTRTSYVSQRCWPRELSWNIWGVS